ncbi:hypothetical protein ACIQHZ_31245 [Streptomyces halstedii]|uniref:hypothetical protein n=1 Tax=Streptomyces halstedii TaxID=1944 RepID=UPI0037F6F897
MSYGTLEWHKEQADYWHKAYGEANKRASAAIAEAKKSKERELTAIRLMLKYKKLHDLIEDSYLKAECLEEFADNILDIMEARENG